MTQSLYMRLHGIFGSQLKLLIGLASNYIFYASYNEVCSDKLVSGLIYYTPFPITILVDLLFFVTTNVHFSSFVTPK